MGEMQGRENAKSAFMWVSLNADEKVCQITYRVTLVLLK